MPKEPVGDVGPPAPTKCSTSTIGRLRPSRRGWRMRPRGWWRRSPASECRYPRSRWRRSSSASARSRPGGRRARGRRGLRHAPAQHAAIDRRSRLDAGDKERGTGRSSSDRPAPIQGSSNLADSSAKKAGPRESRRRHARSLRPWRHRLDVAGRHGTDLDRDFPGDLRLPFGSRADQHQQPFRWS